MNRQRIYEKANLPGILVDTGRTYFHAFLSNHRLIFFYARAVLLSLAEGSVLCEATNYKL